MVEPPPRSSVLLTPACRMLLLLLLPGLAVALLAIILGLLLAVVFAVLPFLDEVPVRVLLGWCLHLLLACLRAEAAFA